MRKALSIFGVALAVFLAGCAMLAPGADPFVVRTEQGQKLAGASFDFVLGIDQMDRGFWKTNAPAFHNFCSWLRTPIPIDRTNAPRAIAMQLNVQSLKIAYKANRDGGTSNALFLAVATLGLAATQAQSWSNIVAIPTR